MHDQYSTRLANSTCTSDVNSSSLGRNHAVLKEAICMDKKLNERALEDLVTMYDKVVDLDNCLNMMGFASSKEIKQIKKNLFVLQRQLEATERQ